MADGRMLHKKISLNEAVASLENDTHRLLFTWAISHLDIDGRISGSPKVFRAIVVPLLEHITSDKVSKFFKDAEFKELIFRYQVGKEWFIQYPKFKDNQRLRPDREAPSKIPPPPDNIGTTPGVIPEEAGSPPALSLSKDKLREDKLREDIASPENGDASPFFICQFFEIDKTFRAKLSTEYPAMTDDLLLKEFSSMEDWLTDNPKTKRANGRLKNPRQFIKNWLNKTIIKPTNLHLPMSKADQVTAANLLAAERVLKKWETKHD